MDATEKDFEFIRGDTAIIGGFQMQDKNRNVLKLEDTDEMYFTVKNNYNQGENYILQKKLSDGGIKYQDGVYYVLLAHDDTANLKYGTYVYDFQIMSEGIVKTIAMGTITLTNEVTHKVNE